MRALVADDDLVTRLMLDRTLGRWGFAVTAVADGAQAFSALAAAEEPILAILDWMMPEMDGVEVLSRVRVRRPLANLYLILLTALESRKDIIAGLDAGADDYIVKPFDPDELRARVQVGMRVLTLQDRLGDRVRELEGALANVKQLHGLLPICSYCKRIRDDNQYWQQVDGYIVQHSEAKFSHGICPACVGEVGKQIDAYSEAKLRSVDG